MTHRRKTNNKPPSLHKNCLVQSGPMVLKLLADVEDRFNQLIRLHENVHGRMLIPPPDLNNDMLRWRRMAVRHKQGDYRYSLAEAKSLESIAAWMLYEKRLLAEQPKPKLSWG